MVAYLLKLKLLLLGNSFRRSPWQLVGVILAGLYALGVIGMLVSAMAFLVDREATFISMVLVLAVSAITLGWALIPLVAFGVDLTLDPARFTTFAMSRPQLAIGLLLSGFIGIPGLLTLLVLSGQFLAWRTEFSTLLAGLLCGVLAAMFCLVLARLTTTTMAQLTGSRRFKDVAGIVVIIPLMLLGPLLVVVTEGIDGLTDLLPRLAQVLGWTPLGVFAAVPGDVATGNTALAVGRLALGLLYLAAAIWAWERALHRAMESPRSAKTSTKAVGMGAFNIFPSTPTGAVAARAMTYWFKDPRYGASIVMVPLLPVVIWFSAGLNGGGEFMLLLGPLLGVLMGFAISADVSYDSTAFSLHVLSGVRGIHDRAGRVLACAAIGLPVTLLASILPPVLLGRADVLPASIGISLCALLTGLGVSSVASARFTYSVPLPGESPFKTPPGAGARIAVVQLATFSVMGVLLAPAAGLGLAQYLTGNDLLGWLAGVVGIVIGSVLLVLGIRIGGRWMDRRAPELMAAVMVNK